MRNYLEIIKPLNCQVPRRELVVVRAGDNSLHHGWTVDQSIPRTWDIFVSYYGDQPEPDTSRCELFVKQKGAKWPPIFDLYQSELFKSYDYVWFPDDDIKTDSANINLLFAICRLFDLKLCQPSLDESSYVSHPITSNVPTSLLRFTNFVEIMMPVMSQDTLKSCAHTFETAKTAWGLDWVWPKLIGYPTNGIAIVDAIQMQHTRPVASNYNLEPAFEEKHANFTNYSVTENTAVISSLLFPC